MPKAPKRPCRYLGCPNLCDKGVYCSKHIQFSADRIYRVVPELDKVTVYARHIFYDLLDNMLKSVKPASDAVGASVVQSISDGCLSEHDFTFYSDLESTAADVSFENINPVEALLGENPCSASQSY